MVAVVLGHRVDVVAVVLGWPHGLEGYMRPKPYRTDATWTHRVLITLAGPLAEVRHEPMRAFREIGTLDVYDNPDARLFLSIDLGVVASSPIVSQELRKHQATAARLVSRHWSWIERVALALSRSRRLTGDEVEQLRFGKAA